jgi:hypothetical protein
MGMIFRPGASGIRVHLFVDSSYGVHVDGRSDTGTCVVIGDQGAVHCRSSKQTIVTKSSAYLPRRSWWDYRTQRIRGTSFGTSCDYRATACRQS